VNWRRHPLSWVLVPIALCAVVLLWAQLGGSKESPPPFEAPPPPDLADVSITQRPGEAVPLDLRFTDEAGREVALAEYFADSRPVILNLVYYRCPGICNALLNGFTEALKEMDWTAGEQFRVVTVSIDPLETPELAADKKAAYMELYGRPAEAGWRFLTGREPQIRALADAVGFGYRYEEGTGLYTHAPGIMICTPQGRLSRYLLDVLFEPATLELALVEASSGTVGSPTQKLMLRFCYTYDPTEGRYVVAARKVMAAGGALLVAAVLGGLGALWVREWRTGRHRLAELQP
jgi:protein SCO1/2